MEAPPPKDAPTLAAKGFQTVNARLFPPLFAEKSLCFGRKPERNPRQRASFATFRREPHERRRARGLMMFQAIPCYQPQNSLCLVQPVAPSLAPSAPATRQPPPSTDPTRQGLLKRPLDTVVTGAGAPGGPLGGNRLR